MKISRLCCTWMQKSDLLAVFIHRWYFHISKCQNIPVVVRDYTQHEKDLCFCLFVSCSFNFCIFTPTIIMIMSDLNYFNILVLWWIFRPMDDNNNNDSSGYNKSIVHFTLERRNYLLLTIVCHIRLAVDYRHVTQWHLKTTNGLPYR